MLNRFLLLMLFFLSLVFGFSLEKALKDQYFYFNLKAAYYPPHAYGSNNQSGFSPSFVTPNFYPISSSYKKFTPSTWGGVKIIANFGFYKFFPLMNNINSLLFKNNGIGIDSSIRLSPVTCSLKSNIGLTPIAFFNVYVTPEIGFGWTFLGFTGIGVNENGNYSTYPGFYFEIKTGGRIQFQ